MKIKNTYYLLMLFLLSGCISDIIKDNGVPEELRKKLVISHIDVKGTYTRAWVTDEYGDYIFSSMDEGDELSASYNFMKSNGDLAYSKNKASSAWVERKRKQTPNGDSTYLSASFSPSIVLPSGGYQWDELQISLRYSDRWTGSNDVLFASTSNDTTVAGGIHVTENVLSVKFRHATALLQIDPMDVVVSDKIVDREVTKLVADVLLAGAHRKCNFVKAESGVWTSVAPTALINDLYAGQTAYLDSLTIHIGSGETEQHFTYAFERNTIPLSDNLIYPISIEVTPFTFLARVETSKITPWESSTLAAVSMDEAPGWYYDKESNTFHIYASRGLQNMYNEGVDVTHSNISLDASIDVTNCSDEIRRSPIKAVGKGCVFNGKNNTITGLYVHGRTGSDYTCIGLVGTNYGIIKNLRIDYARIQSGDDMSLSDANLPANEVSDAGDFCSGILAGRNFGYIYNCSAVNSYIISTKTQYVGGLVGMNIGNDSIMFDDGIIGGTIYNCYVKELGITQVGSGTAAGFVGINKNQGDIAYCYCESPLVASLDVGSVAGFCGSNGGDLSGCCYYGSITDEYGGGRANGFCNMFSQQGTIRFCYSSVSNYPVMQMIATGRASIYYLVSPCEEILTESTEYKPSEEIFDYLYNGSYREGRITHHGYDYWDSENFFDSNKYFPKPLMEQLP